MNDVVVMRWSTDIEADSINGATTNMPGPTTRLMEPNRLTTTRSHAMATRTEEAANDATTRATNAVTRLLPHQQTNKNARANATANTKSENRYEPLRLARFSSISKPLMASERLGQRGPSTLLPAGASLP